MSRAYVVPSVEDLNFWLKRFAPRVRMRVSADAVLAVTSSGEVHVPASISFTRGGGKILGIGGEHADALDTVTVRLFTATGLDAPDYDHLLDKFMRLLQRRVREPFVRVLANAGVAAMVVHPDR